MIENMRIINLQVENVMGIKAIDITPADDLVILGGDNGAGKSSVLNAIAFALGGVSEIPEKPIHEGEAKAKILVNLGDLVVTRILTRTEKGYNTTLEVRTADGAKLSSPQAILDK
jgi:DNA repair exonuclease SbcCD ATPase subunit